MLLLIRADELSLYEADVGVKAIGGRCAGSGVGAGAAENQVDLAHKTLEVRDRRRIPSFWVGAQGVGQWKRRAVDRAWEINMGRHTEGVRLRVGDREGLSARAFALLLIVIRPCRRPKSRT